MDHVEQTEQVDQKPKSKRGFAAMSPEKQREIASKGGKKAHETGKAHKFTSEKAKEAGSKGGRIAHERGTAHKFTSAEASEAGKKGGTASAAKKAEEFSDVVQTGVVQMAQKPESAAS